MSFCFVILNWNGYKLTTSAIENVEKVEDGDFGIIVVDNNSQSDDRNGLIDYAQQRGWTIYNEDDLISTEKSGGLGKIENVRILILANENYGYAKGNNLGLKLAYNLGYEWAIIMNNDVVLETPVVRGLIGLALTDPRIAVIGPRVIDKYGKTQGPSRKRTIYSMFIYPLFYPILYPFEKVRYKKFRESVSSSLIFYPYSVVGCFMVVNLQILSEVNWFDEGTFLYYEEDILSEKLIKKGYKVAYTERFYVKHVHEATTSKLGEKKKKMQLESRIYYLKKYRNYGPIRLSLAKFGFLYSSFVLSPAVVKLKEVLSHAKRNHSGRRFGNKAVSDDTGNE